MKEISVGQAIKAGWKGFKDNLGFFLLATLLIIATKALYYVGMAQLDYGEGHRAFDSFLGAVYYLADFILSLFLQLGLIRVSLEVIRGNKASWKDFPSSLLDLGNFFVSSALYVLMWFFGLILFIFPGVIWGMRYSLYPFFIADLQTGSLDSLKLSSRATYGYKWDLLALFIILTLLGFAALFPIGLGFFIIIPLWSLTFAYFYHHLTPKK